MNTHKEVFANYSSETLLEKRALGDDLSDEAHNAIEEIFAERGEKLPSKPSKPILLDTPETKGDRTLKHVGILVFFFGAAVLAKVLINSWLVFPIAIICTIYYALKWVPHNSKTLENRMEDEGLTEIMICAADGELSRIKELVSFGIDVNSRSKLGTSALMYAVKNNHREVVEFLLEAGADANLTSRKGASALSIATKFQYGDLISILRQSGSR